MDNDDFGRKKWPFPLGKSIKDKDLRRLKRLKDSDLEKLIPTGNSYYFGDEIFEEIRERFPDGSTIVELGGGKSTIELSKHYNVYSVEDKKKYLGLAPDATYIHAQCKPYRDKALESELYWYDRKVLEAKLPDEYDLLIIDGPETKTPYGRYGAARYSHLFNLDVPILIDDLQDPSVYVVAVMLARAKGLDRFDVRITKENRMFAWLG